MKKKPFNWEKFDLKVQMNLQAVIYMCFIMFVGGLAGIVTFIFLSQWHGSPLLLTFFSSCFAVIVAVWTFHLPEYAQQINQIYKRYKEVS